MEILLCYLCFQLIANLLMKDEYLSLLISHLPKYFEILNDKDVKPQLKLIFQLR